MINMFKNIKVRIINKSALKAGGILLPEDGKKKKNTCFLRWIHMYF